MKQDINLLMPATGQRSRHPTAQQCGIVLLSLILLGTATGLWYDHREQTLERQTRTLNAAIDESVFNLEERSNFLAQRNADPDLVADLKRREREADDKSRVLDLLSGESVGNTDGFSAQLAALGRRHPQGLWLERIHIDDGGREVILRGQTVDADLVPEFLDNLRHEPVMAGTPFATLALSADKDQPGPLRFALATGCDIGDAEVASNCVAADEGASAQ